MFGGLRHKYCVSVSRSTLRNIIYILLWFTGGDERQSLVNGADSSSPAPAPLPSRVAALAASTKIPRNCSQPIMAHGSDGIMPKNGSVPNFERRFSKVEYASHMKVKHIVIQNYCVFISFYQMNTQIFY